MTCPFCHSTVIHNRPGTLSKHKGWVYSTTMKAAGPALEYAHNTCIQEEELQVEKPRSRLLAGTNCSFCDLPLRDQDKPRMLTFGWLPKRGLKVHLIQEALAWAHNDCIDTLQQDSLF